MPQSPLVYKKIYRNINIVSNCGESDERNETKLDILLLFMRRSFGRLVENDAISDARYSSGLDIPMSENI